MIDQRERPNSERSYRVPGVRPSSVNVDTPPTPVPYRNVDNVDPIVALTGVTSTDEGTSETYSYTFTDSGADTWTHLTSCGAHGTKSTDSFDQATKSGSFKCTWPDNYTGETVSATVTDDDGGVGSDSKSVNIANVAPTLTISGASAINEGATYSLSLSSSDAGSDTITGCELVN